MDQHCESKKGSRRDDSDNRGQTGGSLQNQFSAFARHEDQESDGQSITLRNIDNWMKHADLLGSTNHQFTNADTATTFSKIARNKNRLNMNEFQDFVEQLAGSKNMRSQDIMSQLQASGQPGATAPRSPGSPGRTAANLDRMNNPTSGSDDQGRRPGQEGQGGAMNIGAGFNPDSLAKK